MLKTWRQGATWRTPVMLIFYTIRVLLALAAMNSAGTPSFPAFANNAEHWHGYNTASAVTAIGTERICDSLPRCC